jgi:competence protein ComEC
MLVAGLLAGPRSPPALLVAALAALALTRRGPLALGAVAALLAGAAIADARLASLDRSALGPLMNRDVELTATLLEHVRTRSFGTHVAAIRLLSATGRGERVLLLAGARVRWPRETQPGTELRIKGHLATLAPYDDYERRRNAHALVRAASIFAPGPRRGGVMGALDTIRRRTERALTSGVPPPQGALVRGMVLGQDEALPADMRESFRATGLTHLVAASGANVILLATLVLAAGTVLGLGLSARLLVALGAVAAYVPLAGGGPSIQRAAVMGAAGLVAGLAGRPGSRWYALLLAAALTLAWNPRASQDAGWQLSFAAVVALIALVPSLTARLRRAGLPHALAAALAVTVAATIGTGPLIALLFERVSLVSLPANVLAAPAVAAVMWLGTVAGALGQVAPGLAVLVSKVAALPLAYLTWLAERAAALPFAELRVGSPRIGVVVAIYLTAGGALLSWRRREARHADREEMGRGRRRGRAAVAVVAALALVAAAWYAARTPAPPHDLTVSFLDIGQGDATLIQHGHMTVLVDTGPPDGPILTRLREAGVHRIDVLVATHAALDHDGAAAAVLAAHPVGLVLDGEEATAPVRTVARLAARHRVRRIATDSGQVIHAGSLELHVLWPRREPPAAPGAEPNDRATVLHVRDGGFDLLLTADAESNATAGIGLPAVEAMKVAHHGSEDSGLPALLARVRPHVAVIEVGAHNSYGHPTPSTLAALRAVPVVRRTDRDGTVRLRVHDGRMIVQSAH